MEMVMQEWLASEIESRLSKGGQGQQIDDFVDAYLAVKKSDSNCETISFEVFMRSMVDNFWAGMETTSQSTSWVLFYLAHFPHWQDRIFEEIEKVVPQNSWPSSEHRVKLISLEAFLHEVFRHCRFIGVCFIIAFTLFLLFETNLFR